MIPFFVESFGDWAVRKWGGRTEAFTNTLAIIVAVVVIALAICSVTTVVHKDKDGKVMYCTTVLGERTDCND